MKRDKHYLEKNMNQYQAIEYLVSYLKKHETYEYYRDIELPINEIRSRQILRALMNIREPYEVDEEFLNVQDIYLKRRLKERGIIDINDLNPIKDNIYLWKGDITTLKCDAIVNAANSKMLGCFIPGHSCIDNAIHTYAGVQLRNECFKLMKIQGHDEPTGSAKITSAYNLPSKYIIHTVGPIIYDEVSEEDEELLGSCYKSCLEVANNYNLESIAFCCISTGEFHFPNNLAAKIAIKTVNEYKKDLKVIFNVFKEEDYDIYFKLLKS